MKIIFFDNHAMEEFEMRVIITGGTGMIGRQLAAILVKDGHEAIALSRDPQRHQGQMPDGVNLVDWDAQSPQGWGELVDGADAIVNLVGENLSARPWSATQKRRIRESRLNGGKAVVEAIRQSKHKPEVVIQASGVNYYGPCGDEIINEEHPAGSDFLSQVCVDWEASSAEVEKMGVRRAIIRSGVVLDKKEGALPRFLLQFRLFAGGPLGSGRQWLSWIHPQDEINAIRFLIEHHEAHGAFNLTSPNPRTNLDFGKAIGRALRRPTLLRVPASMIKLIFGEMSIVVLKGQRAVPQNLSKIGFQFSHPDLQEALKDVIFT
jgi:uncharacterized protein (TIGR01777 family)